MLLSSFRLGRRDLHCVRDRLRQIVDLGRQDRRIEHRLRLEGGNATRARAAASGVVSGTSWARERPPEPAPAGFGLSPARRWERTRARGAAGSGVVSGTSCAAAPAHLSRLRLILLAAQRQLALPDRGALFAQLRTRLPSSPLRAAQERRSAPAPACSSCRRTTARASRSTASARRPRRRSPRPQRTAWRVDREERPLLSSQPPAGRTPSVPTSARASRPAGPAATNAQARLRA